MWKTYMYVCTELCGHISELVHRLDRHPYAYSLNIHAIEFLIYVHRVLLCMLRSRTKCPDLVPSMTCAPRWRCIGQRIDPSLHVHSDNWLETPDKAVYCGLPVAIDNWLGTVENSEHKQTLEHYDVTWGLYKWYTMIHVCTRGLWTDTMLTWAVMF